MQKIPIASSAGGIQERQEQWTNHDGLQRGEILGEDSLTSEWYIPQVMPPVVRTRDLIALFLLNVFWVTNITPMAAGGPASFVYWALCGSAFFIPCVLVSRHLARMFPVGSIYTWTYHALGARWSFFIGLCSWLPGVLSVVNAATAIVSWLQALHGQWLTETWQQGLAILGVLLVVGIISCQPTRTVLHLCNIAAIGMGIATVLLLCSVGFWLGTGHPSATSFVHLSSWRIAPGNFALFGSATLALLGANIPLMMVGEMPRGVSVQGQRNQDVGYSEYGEHGGLGAALTRHLTLGTICTLGGYLLCTFAILVVQGPDAAAATVNPMALLIGTVDRALGSVCGDIMALCLLLYFLLIPVALHLCFARFLLVGAVDRRISIWFARLSRQRLPLNAILAQIAISLGFALVIYFLIPSVSFFGKPADLANIAYNVIGASLLLVWSFSFIFPFVDNMLLLFKQRIVFEQTRILPVSVMMLADSSGILVCLTAIGVTVLNSFIPSLLPNTMWWYIVGGSACGCLLLFAIFSLLTSSEANWEEMQQMREMQQIRHQ